MSARRPTSRTPFVLLMVLLLGGGLLGLLLLNTALNQGSFEESRLKRQNTKLSDEEQALRQQLEAVSAPAELARKAQEMGMIPGAGPAFLDPVTGQVLGSPKPASPRPSPTPLPANTPIPVPGTTPLATAGQAPPQGQPQAAPAAPQAAPTTTSPAPAQGGPAPR